MSGSPDIHDLLRQVRLHHHHARIRLGCAGTALRRPGLTAPIDEPAPGPQEAHTSSSVFHPPAVILYLHRKLPWNYFNHAVVWNREVGDPAELASEVASEMMEAGRPGCFEIELASDLSPSLTGAPDLILPAAAKCEPFCQTSGVWAEMLVRTGYSACDFLLVMARPLEASSPAELSESHPVSGRDVVPYPFAENGYYVQDLPPRSINRQIEVQRIGFESQRRFSSLERKLVRTNIEGGVHYLWAMETGSRNPVGSAAVMAIGSVAELFALSVAPEHRRRGVGRMLVRAGEEYARRCGCELLYLEAEPGSPATTLYHRLGFVPIWHRVSYLYG